MSTNYLTNDSPASHVVPVSLNSEQATSLIVGRAKQIVNRVIEDRGHDKPPFLPQEFCRLMNIKKMMKADLGELSAVLLRFNDGHVIKVNSNHHPVRQRFSCAHEIGHLFFDELKLEPYVRSIEYRTFNPQAERKAQSKARERLCDIAATELLMPHSVFKKYLLGFGTSVYSIERLANVFGVSFQSAAIRIAEVSMEPCITILWRPWRKIKSQVLRLAWRVGPGIQWRGKANYVPVNSIIKHTEKLYRAYEDEAPIKSSKIFKLGTITKRCLIESKGFGRADTRYVLSLAVPDR